MLKMRIKTNQGHIMWDISKCIGNIITTLLIGLFIYAGIQYLQVLSTNIIIK